MSVPKSMQMSWSGIVTWSLLCGVFATVFAALGVLAVRWWNEFVFQDVSTTELIIWGAGLFVFCTLAPLIFLIKVKWVEEEGPAKIADEIERRLNG